SASRPVVPSAPQIASRPPPAGTCTEYASMPDFLRCALMPRSLSASVIRRARFSSMPVRLTRRNLPRLHDGHFLPPGAPADPGSFYNPLYNSAVADAEGGAFELGTD